MSTKYTLRYLFANALKQRPKVSSYSTYDASSSGGIATLAVLIATAIYYTSRDDEKSERSTSSKLIADSIFVASNNVRAAMQIHIPSILTTVRRQYTNCEETATLPNNHSTGIDFSIDKQINYDVFPNLSRHGKHSMLRQILTEQMYNELRTRATSNGITIEDIIRAGVCLPHGSNPPHGVAGVYAGDAESYTTFAPLFDPIIELHHKATTRVRLQRFRTNLNPGQLVEHRLDPNGEYILYTRMRLARSIHGFRFTPCMTRQERRTVERLICDCVKDMDQQPQNSDATSTNDANSTVSNATGGYISVMDMSNTQHDDLVRRQLLFNDPDEYLISSGMARDWPDGRGIYCDTWVGTPNLMIWCNAADHVWIISNAKGGDVQSVFKRMSRAVWALETSLKQRGHSFVEDRRLGFLNASPGDIGTALRASVYIKLVRLGQHKGFHTLMKRLHLEARAEQYSQATTDRKRYTGIFDIGNAEALGKTEVQLINIMIHGVAVCIDLERRLQNGESLDLDKIDIPATIDSLPSVLV